MLASWAHLTRYGHQLHLVEGVVEFEKKTQFRFKKIKEE